MTPTTHITATPAASPRRISPRAALRLDAIVTAANGAAYLVAAGPLGDLLGLSETLLYVLGVVLLACAAGIWLTAARAVPGRAAMLAIVTLSAVWAAASIVLAIGGWASPTTAGTLWIAAQAVVVGGFAELHAAGLKR